MSEQVRHVWLDCDPVCIPFMLSDDNADLSMSQGHDDATAILLAIHLPGLKLLGVSTVRWLRARARNDEHLRIQKPLRCTAMLAQIAREKMLRAAFMRLAHRQAC